MVSKQAVITITLFLVSGTFATFAYKLQSSVTVTEGQHQRNFFHPYMQCFTMFIGEALCLIFYFLNLKKNQIPLQEGKKPHKPWIFIIPALADSCGSTLSYMALCFIQSSTWMMFGGMAIVWTAFFAKILIRIVLEKRHFFGCGLAIIGVTVVGSSVFLESDSQGAASHNQQVLGYVLMLISLVFNGFFLAYEQYLLTKYTINPMEMVGYEGVFGMIITFCLSIMLSYIPCHFGEDNCVYNSKNQSFIELPLVFAKQVFSHTQLIILVVCGLMAIGMYNLNGLRITKLFDALTRSLLGITKTSLVWIIGIIITEIARNNKAYQIQSLSVWANLVKALGFSIIITGTLIYNKLIFKRYFAPQKVKEEIQFRKMLEETVSS